MLSAMFRKCTLKCSYTKDDSDVAKMYVIDVHIHELARLYPAMLTKCTFQTFCLNVAGECLRNVLPKCWVQMLYKMLIKCTSEMYI